MRPTCERVKVGITTRKQGISFGAGVISCTLHRIQLLEDLLASNAIQAEVHHVAETDEGCAEGSCAHLPGNGPCCPCGDAEMGHQDQHEVTDFEVGDNVARLENADGEGVAGVDVRKTAHAQVRSQLTSPFDLLDP